MFLMFMVKQFYIAILS